MATPPLTIDVTPTPAEFGNLARMFARAVVDDARRERQHDTGKLLGQLVQVVCYLARTLPDLEVISLIAEIQRDADRPAPPPARVRCSCDEIPWARQPCPSFATGPDGWCDDCRACVDEAAEAADEAGDAR